MASHVVESQSFSSLQLTPSAFTCDLFKLLLDMDNYDNNINYDHDASIYICNSRYYIYINYTS